MTYVGKQFDLPEGAEIAGTVILGYKDRLEAAIFESTLEAFKLTPSSITPDGWYDARVTNELLKQIYEKPGGVSTMVAMGKATAEAMTTIFEIQDIHQFLQHTINEINRSTIRNVPEEYALFATQLADQHYHIKNNTAIPNDMLYGYLWQFINVLKQPGEDFQVQYLGGYDPNLEEGATFEVIWG